MLKEPRCSDCRSCKVKLGIVRCKAKSDGVWFDYKGDERTAKLKNKPGKLFGQGRRRDSELNKRAEQCNSFDSMDDE